ALACQRAENQFVGARCGIMDQFIATVGKAGSAIVLDCRSLAFDYAPLPAGITLVLANTMVKHSIAGGEYNRRRQECEQAVAILRRHLPDVRALRDIAPEQLARFVNDLPEILLRRSRHVGAETGRVLEMPAALAS